jgi:hypothetical protein
VRLTHLKEHHHLDNQISGEGIQQEVHLHKEQQLGDPVQEILFKDLHRAEVVVRHSFQWKDMIPPFGYQNLEERQQKTLRNTYLFVQISRMKNR